MTDHDSGIAIPEAVVTEAPVPLRRVLSDAQGGFRFPLVRGLTTKLLRVTAPGYASALVPVRDDSDGKRLPWMTVIGVDPETGSQKGFGYADENGCFPFSVAVGMTPDRTHPRTRSRGRKVCLRARPCGADLEPSRFMRPDVRRSGVARDRRDALIARLAVLL